MLTCTFLLQCILTALFFHRIPARVFTDVPIYDPMARTTVYVYHGLGVSATSLRMLKTTLDRTCDLEKHNVQLITPDEVIKGSWRDDAALFAMGGGYDQGMISALGDQGQAQIRDYVRQGGSYVGFCAGGYFGCDYIEFDKGGPQEVVGPRQLKFFPGKCIGPVFPNFDYFSEAGTQAPLVSWEAEPGSKDFHVYFNGGGHFVPYPASTSPTASEDGDMIQINELPHALGDMIKRFGVSNWTVLSRYLEVPGQPIAAVVTHVGQGRAILTGIHPEFIPDLLDQQDPYLQDKLPLLKGSNDQRRTVVASILTILGVHTVREDNSMEATDVSDLVMTVR